MTIGASRIASGCAIHGMLDRNAIVGRFASQGYQMAIHAIGDRGIDQALEAIAAAGAAHPDSPGHRIEHTAVVRPGQMRRFEEVRAVGVLFAAIRPAP